MPGSHASSAAPASEAAPSRRRRRGSADASAAQTDAGRGGGGGDATPSTPTDAQNASHRPARWTLRSVAPYVVPLPFILPQWLLFGRLATASHGTLSALSLGAASLLYTTVGVLHVDGADASITAWQRVSGLLSGELGRLAGAFGLGNGAAGGERSFMLLDAVVALALTAAATVVVPKIVDALHPRGQARVRARRLHENEYSSGGASKAKTAVAVVAASANLVYLTLRPVLWGWDAASSTQSAYAWSESLFAARAMLALCHTAPWMMAVAASGLWVPVTPRRLESAEAALLEANVKHSHVTTRRCAVSGIHSIDAVATTPGAAGSGSRGKDAAARGSGAHKDAIVLLHGYGAASAFWMLNIDDLANCGRFSHVIAADWLGTGRSARPRVPDAAFDTPEHAEGAFVDALDAWRRHHPVLRDGNPFVLVGHSLGCVIATAFAQKHPEVVRHLVLASPVAVPHPPRGSMGAPHRGSDKEAREEEEKNPGSADNGDSGKPAAQKLPVIFRIIRFLWVRVSPASLVRAAGPLGPRLVEWLLTKRASRMTPASPLRTGEVPVSMLAEYTYSHWAARKSYGDTAHQTLLLPGAWAKGVPLSERLTPDRMPPAMPLTLIYGGAADWMDHTHAEPIVQRLSEAGHCFVELRHVEAGGHQLFLNNARGFNDAVITSCDKARKALASS